MKQYHVASVLAQKDHYAVDKLLVRKPAKKTTGEMLLTIHLLLSLVLHVYGQKERDRACTMLIVVDQVLNPKSNPRKVKLQLTPPDCMA